MNISFILNIVNPKILKTLLLFWGLATSVLAQQVIERPQLFKRPSPYERYTTYRVSFTGGLAMPMGTFKEYMNQSTLRNYGLAMDFVFPQNNLSVGLSAGSTYFKHRLPREVQVFEDGAISAVQTRTFSATPILLTGSYHLAKVNAPVRPYVQVGAGAAFANLINYYGSLPTGTDGFKLVGQVGAGVRIQPKKEGKLGFEASANYQYLPFQWESEGISDASTLQIRAGIFYRWW
ncbi:MAG: hypothetical protein MUE30_02940 [Spirosomaceae bacterium]|jgi:hypothetical protein|nr:hypothetical protein [Spirosomataceae bacterium]